MRTVRLVLCGKGVANSELQPLTWLLLGVCCCTAGVWQLWWQREWARGTRGVAADWCWPDHGGGSYGLQLQGELTVRLVCMQEMDPSVKWFLLSARGKF